MEQYRWMKRMPWNEYEFDTEKVFEDKIKLELCSRSVKYNIHLTILLSYIFLTVLLSIKYRKKLMQISKSKFKTSELF